VFLLITNISYLLLIARENYWFFVILILYFAHSCQILKPGIPVSS